MKFDHPDQIKQNERCPICMKKLDVIVSKVIYEHRGIRYCSKHCLEMGIKQLEEGAELDY